MKDSWRENCLCLPKGLVAFELMVILILLIGLIFSLVVIYRKGKKRKVEEHGDGAQSSYYLCHDKCNKEESVKETRFLNAEPSLCLKRTLQKEPVEETYEEMANDIYEPLETRVFNPAPKLCINQIDPQEETYEERTNDKYEPLKTRFINPPPTMPFVKNNGNDIGEEEYEEIENDLYESFDIRVSNKTSELNVPKDVLIEDEYEEISNDLYEDLETRVRINW